MYIAYSLYSLHVDPPNVTAPNLECFEGCCSLPIITVTTDSDDVYLVCNVLDSHDTSLSIRWYNGDTMAEGINNKEVLCAS